MWNWGSSDNNKTSSFEDLITNNRCVMFSMPSCSWCVKAEDFFKAKKLKCQTTNLQDSQFLAFEVIKATGQRTVPNIFIDGQHVGGHDQLLDTFEKCRKSNEALVCDFLTGKSRRKI